MRIILFAVAMAVASSSVALAEGSSCTATAMDKKLAGAAKTSFMKKCEAGG